MDMTPKLVRYSDFDMIKINFYKILKTLFKLININLFIK